MVMEFLDWGLCLGLLLAQPVHCWDLQPCATVARLAGEFARAVSFINDVGLVHLLAPAGTVLYHGRPLDVTRSEQWNCTLDTSR